MKRGEETGTERKGEEKRRREEGRGRERRHEHPTFSWLIN